MGEGRGSAEKEGVVGRSKGLAILINVTIQRFKGKANPCNYHVKIRYFVGICNGQPPPSHPMYLLSS